MRIINPIVLAVMLLISPLTSASSDIVVSHSQVSGISTPYVGVSLGSADYDLANDSSPSFSIFAGLALNELLAIELGMADFGDVGNFSTRSEASAIYGSVVADVALSNEVSAFGRLGLASWDYSVGSLNDSSVDVFWGVGLDYDIGRDLAARFAIQQFSVDASFSNNAPQNEDILNVNIGLIYHF